MSADNVAELRAILKEKLGREITKREAHDIWTENNINGYVPCEPLLRILAKYGYRKYVLCLKQRRHQIYHILVEVRVAL